MTGVISLTIIVVNVTYQYLSPVQRASGCSFKLSWNPSILQCLSIQEVAFHNLQRAEQLGYAFLSGNSVWFTLTFDCTGHSETYITLSPMKVGDDVGEPKIPVDFDNTHWSREARKISNLQTLDQRKASLYDRAFAALWRKFLSLKS